MAHLLFVVEPGGWEGVFGDADEGERAEVEGWGDGVDEVADDGGLEDIGAGAAEAAEGAGAIEGDLLAEVVEFGEHGEEAWGRALGGGHGRAGSGRGIWCWRREGRRQGVNGVLTLGGKPDAVGVSAVSATRNRQAKIP